MGKWEMVKLGDVCEKKIATLPAGFTEKIIYIDISSVDNDLKKIISFQEINGEDAPSRAKQLLEENDILVSTVRPNLNAIALNTLKSSYTIVASTGYCVLRCKRNVDSRYIFHFCKAERFIGALVKVAKGASYPAVNNNDVKNVEIPCLPLDEQKRIAKNLDLASEIVKGYKEQLAELDKLVQSVFYEMFGSIKGEVKLSHYIKSLMAGKSLAGKEKCGNKVLKTGAVSYNYFDKSAVKDLPIDYEPTKSDFVRQGDVIISRMNTIELVGAAAYVWAVDENTYLPDRLWRAELFKNISNPIFVWQILIQETTKQQIRKVASGTSGSMKNISKSNLCNISVIDVPLPLQTRFAEIVTSIEAQKTQVQQALAEAENLFNSLMQEYFE